MNAKISVFVICVEAIIYLLLYKLHHYNFKSKLTTDIEIECVPLMEFSSLSEDIYVKTRKSSQNNDLDMCEFAGINKNLQSIQGGLVNNTSKLTEIDE